MDLGGFDLLSVVLILLFALMVGFDIGESSIKRGIAHYGCEAVQKTWKESR